MILASGCFDGLHAGHVAYIEEAARLCDTGEQLAVAVASDDYIHLMKGHAPKWAIDARMAVILSLSAVDVVVAHGLSGAADAIHVVRPRVFVKGIDWEGKLPVDVQNACDEVGCEIVFVDSGITLHTSDHAVPTQ